MELIKGKKISKNVSGIALKSMFSALREAGADIQKTTTGGYKVFCNTELVLRALKAPSGYAVTMKKELFV